MTHTTNPEKIRTDTFTLSSILGLKGSPIGVKIVQAPDVPPFAGDQRPMRFCQALMQARHGEKSLITGENITCPAAARAFGFKPLPEPLRTGKGLVGFGIVSDETVAQQMFEGMTTLPPGSVKQLEIFPLDMADEVPDIIIIEDEPEKLMWVALSYLHAHGGKRVQGSTAILQATCVDSCIIPFLENRLNYGLGCYGCRDATDMGSGEAIIGFPADELPAIVSHLEYLAKKALPHSRDKHAFSAFSKDHVGTGCGSL
jgi:uncharacterized protein (DUF169 family)